MPVYTNGLLREIAHKDGGLSTGIDDPDVNSHASARLTVLVVGNAASDPGLRKRTVAVIQKEQVPLRVICYDEVGPGVPICIKRGYAERLVAMRLYSRSKPCLFGALLKRSISVVSVVTPPDSIV